MLPFSKFILGHLTFKGEMHFSKQQFIQIILNIALITFYESLSIPSLIQPRTMDTPSRTAGGPKEESNTSGRASPSSDHAMLGNVTAPLPGTTGICTPATHTDASLPSSSDNTLQGSGAVPLPGTNEIYTRTTQADVHLPLPSDNTQQGTVAAPLPGISGTISSVTVSMEDASVSKVFTLMFTADLFFTVYSTGQNSYLTAYVTYIYQIKAHV